MFGWALTRLSNLSLIVGGVVLFAMMIHVSLDILLKYAIHRPIPGTLETVSAYYMVGGVFFPLAAVELTRSSISVDVIYQYLPSWMKVFSMLLVLVGCAGFYMLLAYTSFGDAMRSYAIDEKILGTTTVRIWPSRFVLPVGLTLASLICLLHLYRFATDKQARMALVETHNPEEEV